MNIEKIKEIIIPILYKHKLELYSLKSKREFGMSILEILVEGDKIDAQTLGKVNQEINDGIDEYLPNNYYLEVSTAGAVRPLRNIDEVKKHIGKYIKVKEEHGSTKGVLEKVEENIMFIKVNNKGRMTVVKFVFDEVKEVILTVMF